VIRRFNVGLRRRDPAAGLGFNINPRNGYWVAAPDDDDDDGPIDPTRATPQPIVPYVEDRKNALLLRFDGDTRDPAQMADLQYALIRGLEMIFQLEEGELLGEALPSRYDRRAILIYEAAEGGAGVLSRIVDDPKALSVVVRKAIELCHFDLKHFIAEEMRPDAIRDVDGAKCVAGCYRCLLSYYNQMDHDVIDRRDESFRDMLGRMARADVKIAEQPAASSDASDTIDVFRAAVIAHGLQPFDQKPLTIDGHLLPYTWRSQRVVAVPEAECSALRAMLEEQSLVVIELPVGRETDPSVLNTIAAALTGAAK